MSLKDVPVRARLWAPDRSLPRFFGRLLLFFVRFNLTSFAQYLRAAETRGGVAQACRAAPSGDEDVRKCCPREPCCTLGRRKRAEVSLKRAVLHPRATKMYESVAQGSRAAPSGDEDVRKCRSSVPCCTLGRRRCTKVLPKGAVLHPRATKMYESVAQESRAALLGNDKCGFRRRRVSFIHTSFCPAPLGNGKARKSRLTVPRVTFGCGTVRRHRSRRARRRPLLLSLDGFRWPVAWSCGHYIRHIRLIFGNFYYFCPEACHTASRSVPVTQGRSGIQTESVTDGRQVIYQSIAELIGLTRL